jgi:tetratricopeptide (TPR) repeat protein
MDVAKLETFTGRFQVNPDRVLTIKPALGAAAAKSRLLAYPTGDPEFELFPISETTFVRRASSIKYDFVRDAAADGASGFTAIRLTSPGGSVDAKRISADTLVPYELLLSGKVSEAIEGYRKIKQGTPNNVTVQEGRINGIGYNLMQQKKFSEAIALLKLNIEFYPKSWNAYDSLGEAYMTNGEKDLAIANYKKSLELNPQNSNAREKLKKLEGQ